MMNEILTAAEIKIIDAIDYVSEYPVEMGMTWDEVCEMIISYSSDWFDPDEFDEEEFDDAA